MRIACLGWGSLIWDPDTLPLSPAQPPRWFRDGPRIPIEFARRSRDNRLTLVVVPRDPAKEVPTLWACLSCSTISDAKFELATRELRNPHPSPRWIAQNIGAWTKAGTSNPLPGIDIGQWAQSKGLEGVVWTALGPNFGSPPRPPTWAEAERHLKSLSGTEAMAAKEYVRRTPKQVLTEFRPHIEQTFNWTYDGSRTDPEIN